MDKSDAVKEAATKLYEDLLAAGVDVLLDDRGERPGVMFAEMELIGIPHRIVIGDRGLKDNQVEYQARTSTEAQSVALSDVAGFILKAVAS
jgi:prolyl-tRNA synthetase